jgi:hypothetical protein
VNRPARLAAGLSVASLVGIVPHVMEDLRYGQAANFHMSTVQFEWFSGVVVLATAAAAMACLSRSQWGAYAVVLIGAVWAVLGAADHLRAFLPGEFRSGLGSRLWIWLIVTLQAAASISAAVALLSAHAAVDGAGTDHG